MLYFAPDDPDLKSSLEELIITHKYWRKCKRSDRLRGWIDQYCEYFFLWGMEVIIERFLYTQEWMQGREPSAGGEEKTRGCNSHI